MLHLNTDQTEARLNAADLIHALRQSFAQGAQVPARHVHAIDHPDTPGTVLIMPAWNDDGYLGVKVINIFPNNSSQGLPGLHATYTLYSATTGVPLAQLDGDVITTFRTACASALGASFLARDDAQTLLVVGSGRVASRVPDAMRAVRPIRKVLVWNVRHDSAQRLAQTLRQQGFDAQAVTDLEAAARQADIISCATLSEQPLVRGEWLQPGAHLDLIGSFKPTMRETDAACFDAGKAVYVDTMEAPTKSGDLLAAFDAGTLRREDIRGTLEDLCRGTAPGRTDAAQITVFKGVGSALEDLTTAQLVFEAKTPY